MPDPTDPSVGAVLQWLGPAIIALVAALGATVLANAAGQRRESELERERRVLDSSADALKALHDFIDAAELSAEISGYVHSNQDLPDKEREDLRQGAGDQWRAMDRARTSFARHATLIQLHAPGPTGESVQEIRYRLNARLNEAEFFDLLEGSGHRVSTSLEQDRREFVSIIHALTRAKRRWRPRLGQERDKDAPL